MSVALEELELRPFNKKEHDREGFSCGEPSLDDYLRRQATQDAKRSAAVVHVLVDPHAPREIIGYFTLANVGVRLDALPDHQKKNLAPYPQVPATLIGRLAVATAHQGAGCGGELLRRAFDICLEASRSRTASSLIIVDALHEKAAEFYRKYGFRAFDDGGEYPKKLYIPLASVKKARS